MLAEIISIGDELTSGQRLDTNSQWLSERLGELGIRVMYHTTVADDLAANVRVFREAIDRADLVIASGGLGPTADDLTRQALAETVGVELVRDDAALAHIQRMFAHRKREMPASNVVQAMFPHGSRVIPNPHGTAPGIDLDVLRAGRVASRVFALPGVPAEMREMWQQTVAPALEATAGPNRQVIRHRRIKCFGVGESDLEAMLPDMIRRGRDPQVGITVSKATITLRITATANSPDECYAHMEPTLATIRQCLGNLIFGEEDDELQHVVVRQLAARNQTLATTDHGTRGLLAHWLSEAARDTRVHVGSMIVGEANEQAVLSEPDSVGVIARSCREQFDTDFAIAIGGTPPIVAPGTPVGNISIALASRANVEIRSFPFSGHPDILLPRTAKQALNLLRLALHT